MNLLSRVTKYLATVRDIQGLLDKVSTDNVSKSEGVFLNGAKNDLAKLEAELYSEQERIAAEQMYPAHVYENVVKQHD